MSTAVEYAECIDCDAKFTNQDEARAHGSATMAPTGELPVTAKGHGWRVTNPTPEETAARRVRSIVSYAIQDAVDDAIGELIREVERGSITREQVRDEIAFFPDFCDAWDEADE